MKLRHLVIAALACTSVGALAAANKTSANSPPASNQGYNSPLESQANKSWQASSSTQGDNSQVSQIQQALNDKGLDAGPVDGKMGPKTKSALKQFQQQQGLQASGQADSQTLAALSINGSASASSSQSSSTNGSSTSGMSGTNGSTTSSGTNGMSGTNGSSSSSPSPQGNDTQGTSSTGNGGNAQPSGTDRGASQG